MIKYFSCLPFGKGRLRCPVCSSRVKKFNRIGDEYLRAFEESLFPHSLFAFETLNVLAYSCPRCGASDRTRLYKLFLDRVIPHYAQIKLLDFAPDPILAAQLRKVKGLSYRSADIHGRNVDDRVDIMDMSIYPDDSFDIIICSHVLEHVSNDRQAMKELHRVLAPGGKAILMVPILLTITEVDEDAGITSPQERMKRFGQDDHIRLYSKNGFVERLEEAGFGVQKVGTGFFGPDDFARSGISGRSVLYVGNK